VVYTEFFHILFRYGGPDTQKVTRAFSLTWEHYLSSMHNIVIGMLDAPGTAGRGDTWRHANYRDLGTTEVDGTIEAGRWVGPRTNLSTARLKWFLDGLGGVFTCH